MTDVPEPVAVGLLTYSTERAERIERRLRELDDLGDAISDAGWARIREILAMQDSHGQAYVCAYLGWAAANPHKLPRTGPAA